MGFKFKVNEKTSLEDARKFLDELKSANVKEFYLNDIRRVIDYLNVQEIQAKGGSAVRFQHTSLKGHPYYLNGIFTIHIQHKGGDQQVISKNDYKTYLYGPLVQIIELLEKAKKS